MPPRHAFWTIIYGNAPTSFRAATRDELLPTLKQLQSTHPDAVLMWFARGRLWASPEEAREALERRRSRAPERRERWGRPGERDRDRPRERRDERHEPPREQRWREKPGERPGPGSPKPRSGDGGRSGEGGRGRDWRPGGQHRDPRDRFKVPRDVRRKRFAAKVRRNAVSPKPPRKKKDEE